MVNFLLVVLLMQSAQVTLGADTQPTCANKDGQPEGSCVVPEEDSADSTNLLQTNADVKRHKYQAHDKAKEEQQLHDLFAIVSKLDAKEVFKSVDADNSGDLDESEIQALGKNDPMVVGLFKSQFPILEDPNWWRESGFDADKDGRLSKDEFMTVAKEVSSFLQTAEKSMASQKMEQRMASDSMDAEAKSTPKEVGSDTKGQIAGLLEDADEDEDVEEVGHLDPEKVVFADVEKNSKAGKDAHAGLQTEQEALKARADEIKYQSRGNQTQERMLAKTRDMERSLDNKYQGCEKNGTTYDHEYCYTKCTPTARRRRNTERSGYDRPPTECIRQYGNVGSGTLEYYDLVTYSKCCDGEWKTGRTMHRDGVSCEFSTTGSSCNLGASDCSLWC